MPTRYWMGRWSAALSVALLWLTAGCNFGPRADYHKLDLVDISGTVTLDGRPLPGALVTFEEPDQTFSYGRTDASGRYRLMLNSEKSGIVPGEKLVRISTTATAGEDEGDEEDPDAKTTGGAANPELVPARYNRQSQLRVTVTGNDSHCDFDL